MKVVFIRPERCVGCKQCMLACAAAHSHSKTLLGALTEVPLSLPRIHIGEGFQGEPFPNRCRHCDPAPCKTACLPGAIHRDPKTGTVSVEARRCIRCGSCAMSCPFGVIRFHKDPLQDPNRAIALKCDNCAERQGQGQVPACVEICKVGALVFQDINEVMDAKTREIARRTTLGVRESYGEVLPSSVDFLRQLKSRMVTL